MKFETKKFVKRITAVGAAALMTMMPISGGLANLASLTDNFIANGEFDAYIAVGTCTWNTEAICTNSAEMAMDIAGAIEISAAFAQQAKIETASEAIFEREVKTGHLNDSYFAIGAFNEGQTWDASSTGFSWIANKTVQNATNDDFANVMGELSVMPNTIYLKEDGRLYIGNGAIAYTLTFDKGVGANTKGIPFPNGNEYQIISYTSNGDEQNITLGNMNSITTGLGAENSIGDSGVTIKLIAATASTPSEAKVLIKDADGTVLADEYWTEGTSYINDKSGVSISLKTFKVLSDGTIDAIIDYTTRTMKLTDSDVIVRESAEYPGWTTHIGTDGEGITSIAWKHYNPLGEYVELGTEIGLLDGFFKLSANDLKINSESKETTTAIFNDGSGYEMVFPDENNTMHYIDTSLIQRTFSTAPNNDTMFTWLENRMWRAQLIGDGSTMNLSNSAAWDDPSKDIEVQNDVPFEINLPGFSAYANAIWDGAKMNLTLVGLETDSGMPLTYEIDSGAMITEPNGNTIAIVWEEGKIAKVETTHLSEVIASAGDTVYTIDWGTKLTRTSDSQITVELPDAPRIGDVAIGREDKIAYTLSVGEYSKEMDATLASAGTITTMNPIKIGMAKLDTEITTSELEKPIILIGGPSVNALVKELVDANKSRSAADYEIDRAYIELIEDAFNGKDALVIAGHAGKDTRLAAQMVASQVLGTDMGLTGESIVLNTAGATVSDITVV